MATHHSVPLVSVLPLGGQGPEDLSFFADGSLLTGMWDGRLIPVSAEFDAFHVVAETGGRPLGIERKSEHQVIVCDPQRGLLEVDLVTGKVEILVDQLDGQPMRMCDIATDGSVYFSVSSTVEGDRYFHGGPDIDCG